MVQNPALGVQDKYYRQVVHNDPYGRIFVVEIIHLGEVVLVYGNLCPYLGYSE